MAWYVLRVIVNGERQVDKFLSDVRSLDMLPVLPIQKEVYHTRKRGDRRATQTIRERPALPGYAFIEADGDLNWLEVLSIKSVIEVISYEPEKEGVIRKFLTMCAYSGLIIQHADFPVPDRADPTQISAGDLIEMLEFEILGKTQGVVESVKGDVIKARFPFFGGTRKATVEAHKVRKVT